MLTADSLEAILFVAGEDGVAITAIATALGIDSAAVERVSSELQSLCSSSSRPYNVVSVRGQLSLVTKPTYSETISKVRVEIERQPLTKAHIEVLSVLIYNGPTAKTDVDAYRGVNSGQALRALALRGMVEKTGTSHGSTVFAVSNDVLNMLGVSRVEDLPQYKSLQEKLRTVETQNQ